MASARIQRWALTLSAYDYKIVHKPGSRHANADGLSRLPLPEKPLEVPLPGELICLLESFPMSALTLAKIKQGTDRDPLLSRVRENLLRGWEDTVEEEMRPFQNRRHELSVLNGCVL